jgi:diguanylate cyclase
MVQSFPSFRDARKQRELATRLGRKGPQAGLKNAVKIIHQFSVAADQTAAQIETLKEQVFVDALTGLPNRRHCGDPETDGFIKHTAGVAKRTRVAVLIFTFDCDHFSKINNKYGHPTGDAALKYVAATIKKTLRETDYVARTGGEEFFGAAYITIKEKELTPEEREQKIKEGAEKILEKIRATVEKGGYPINENPNNLGKITISLGGVIYRGEDIPVATLFADADAALYRSKEEGRNRATLVLQPSGIMSCRIESKPAPGANGPAPR